MLNNLKVYLGCNDEALLDTLIGNAKDFAVSYTGLPEYSEKLDHIIFKMVVEDYNRKGSEGISNKNYSGVAESYLTDYSAGIYKALRRFRKIKVVG